MKTTTMTALAVLMLAAAAPAIAQERGGEGRELRQADRDRPHRGEHSQAGQARRAPEAVPAPQAPEAPRAAEAGAGQPPVVRRSERPRIDRRRGDGEILGRPGRWVDSDGDESPSFGDADRADREDRQEARDARRWTGGDRRWDGDRDGRRDGRDVQGRDGRGDRDGRPGVDRRDGRDWNGRWGGEDRTRWDRHDRDRDRRRGHRPYWSQGRYPFSYHSSRRYRGSIWMAPPGFYARSWSYGDFLPYGWYGDSYRLNDWWNYGLPWPPPGYDWVRVGPDALLIDRFSGRVVQVVRMLFY